MINEGAVCPWKGKSATHEGCTKHMEANSDKVTRLLNYVTFSTHKINWHPKHLFNMHKVFLFILSLLTMSQNYNIKSMFMHKKKSAHLDSLLRPNISLSWVFLGKQKQTVHVKRNKTSNIEGSCISQIWLRKRRLFGPKKIKDHTLETSQHRNWKQIFG